MAQYAESCDYAVTPRNGVLYELWVALMKSKFVCVHCGLCDYTIHLEKGPEFCVTGSCVFPLSGYANSVENYHLWLLPVIYALV